MIELCYDSYSLALFAVSQDMGSRRLMEFMEKIYTEEHNFSILIILKTRRCCFQIRCTG